MGKDKLKKFKELESFPNVFQNHDYRTNRLVNFRGEEMNFKGRWSSSIFSNQHPLILELACGKGEYAIGLAKNFPDKNFIGIDVKGARIWRGAKTAIEEQISNVAFARMRINNLVNFFDRDEVSEIWITFSDPFPKNHDAEKRLTSKTFLDIYRNVCRTDAVIHLKTDSFMFYNSTLESLLQNGCRILESNDDIYGNGVQQEELLIKTFYECIHLKDQKTIKYLKFLL